jgi:hypothetical protein
VAGDFFRELPAGGDAYLLKSVLHDWDDARAAEILRVCRRAMGLASRLLVVEQPLGVPSSRALSRSDLTMLVAHGAGERSEADYRALLGAAGFEVRRVVPAGATFRVIDARPTPPPSAGR